MLRGRLMGIIVVVSIMTLGTFYLSPVHAQTHRPSPADCDAYAKNYARDHGGIIGGAIKGGAGGALFGAIVGGKGNRGRSARRGAALGGLIGGLSSAKRKGDAHRRAYERCMDGRVHW